MNRVNLIGRLTRDIELRYIGESGTACVKTSIAINRGKVKNGNDRGADFIPVTVFGRQAENMDRYTNKGNRIAIEGHIQTGSYTTQSGETRYTTDVIADRVEFIDFKETGGRSENGASDGGNDLPAGFQAVNDDDVPF